MDVRRGGLLCDSHPLSSESCAGDLAHKEEVFSGSLLYSPFQEKREEVFYWKVSLFDRKIGENRKLFIVFLFRRSHVSRTRSSFVCVPLAKKIS